MAEIVADLLHRQAVVEQMLRYAVAQRMRTAPLACDADPVEAASDDVRYRAPGQRTEWGTQREEQRALGARRSQLADVAKDRLSDAARERIVMRPSRLRTADPQCLFLPVNVVEPQTGDLASAQAIGDQHHQNGAVAHIGWPAALGRGEQSQDLLPIQSLGEGLAGMESRRHDPFGQPRLAPAPAFGEPEEGTKTLHVVVDRDPAIAAGVPAQDLPVDVGDLKRGQSDLEFFQPIEKTIDSAEATEDRLFGPAALFAHPRLEDPDFAYVGVS